MKYSASLNNILFYYVQRPTSITRAGKGWAVKRARPSKKVWCSGLGLCLQMSLVFDFGQGLDVVCTLVTAAVTELWQLDLFPCTSSSFLCAGTLSPRGKCCYFFCGRFSWRRQTSFSKGFFYYFHDSTTELYFRSATRQIAPMWMLFQNKNN